MEIIKSSPKGVSGGHIGMLDFYPYSAEMRYPFPYPSNASRDPSRKLELSSPSVVVTKHGPPYGTFIALLAKL